MALVSLLFRVDVQFFPSLGYLFCNCLCMVFFSTSFALVHTSWWGKKCEKYEQMRHIVISAVFFLFFALSIHISQWRIQTYIFLCWMLVVVVLSSEKRRAHCTSYSRHHWLLFDAKNCDSALQMMELAFRATASHRHTQMVRRSDWPGWQSAKGQKIMGLHDDDIDDSKILWLDAKGREGASVRNRIRDCIMRWWCAWPIFTKYCMVMTSFQESCQHIHRM